MLPDEAAAAAYCVGVMGEVITVCWGDGRADVAKVD